MGMSYRGATSHLSSRVDMSIRYGAEACEPEMAIKAWTAQLKELCVFRGLQIAPTPSVSFCISETPGKAREVATARNSCGKLESCSRWRRLLKVRR